MKVMSTWKAVQTFIFLTLTSLDSNKSKQKMFDKILESPENAKLRFSKGQAQG